MQLVRNHDRERAVDGLRAWTGTMSRFGSAEFTARPEKSGSCRLGHPALKQDGLDLPGADRIVVRHPELTPAAAWTYLAAAVDQHGPESGRNS